MRSSSLILLAALTGCATVATPPVKMLPPVELVQPCPEPSGSPTTNGAMAVYLLDLRDALRGCNRQIDALREWADYKDNE